MRIIALMNQKGGVGKTTTTVNLGAALAEAGKRVCLIDMDPQAHLTINYNVEPSPDIVSLYNILVEEKSLAEGLIEAEDRISLIPSSIDLAAAEIEMVSVLGREQVLKKRLEAAGLDFDYMLLDCPPSLGLLTLNALSVANDVIIPMQPHFLALQGVGKLLETVHLVSRRMNPGLKVCGIVLTMFDSQTKLSAEVVNDLNSFIESAKGKALPWANARIFRSKIRRNIKLAESPSFGQNILRYDPLSNGAADYRALAKELLSMEGTTVPPGGLAPQVPAAVTAADLAILADLPPEAPIAIPMPVAEPAVTPPPVEVVPAPGADTAAGESSPIQVMDGFVSQPVGAKTVGAPDAPPAAPAKAKAKPRKKIPTLVSPEEAARLKAAGNTEVIGDEPRPQ